MRITNISIPQATSPSTHGTATSIPRRNIQASAPTLEAESTLLNTPHEHATITRHCALTRHPFVVRFVLVRLRGTRHAHAIGGRRCRRGVKKFATVAHPPRLYTRCAEKAILILKQANRTRSARGVGSGRGIYHSVRTGGTPTHGHARGQDVRGGVLEHVRCTRQTRAVGASVVIGGVGVLTSVAQRAGGTRIALEVLQRLERIGIACSACAVGGDRGYGYRVRASSASRNVSTQAV